MSKGRDLSCGCGPVQHPAPPIIPAGLATLIERQAAGFPEFREAMLHVIPTYAPLSDWRARGEGDPGVMLLEAWAYVLDVIGFYDARIAERSYLGTAPDEIAARRLTMLLGHRPRPAIAARVTLAAENDSNDPVILPVGTAFRSEPFDDEPPQVFELGTETTIWSQRNAWLLAPVREDVFDGTLRFRPRRGPNPGAIVIIWSQGGSAPSAAARIEDVETETALDGDTYLRASLEEGTYTGIDELVAEDDLKLSDLRAAIARLPLGLTGFTSIANTSGATFLSFMSDFGADTTSVVLDAVYPQARPGARAVAEIDGMLYACEITTVELVLATIDSTLGTTAPLTRVTFTPHLHMDADFLLHVNPGLLGRPTRVAKTEIALADISGNGALVPPVEELGDAPAAGNVILRGDRALGELVAGTVNEESDGAASFVPDGEAEEFAGKLATPVRLYGNTLEAVRGETVIDEVLGSADAGSPFNTFKLQKKPLTWTEDASASDGRLPELTVRVDGISWDRVDTFFGHGPDEHIYIVRLETDGSSSVVFGDGLRGARPPTGVNNVHADYRHGAGSARPPAGTVNQIVAPIKGLAGIRGPLAATGGADPETEDELRDSAPAGALTLGRAVSYADFEALARQFSGIVNAAAGWAWDERRQRAGVKIWYITDAGVPSDELTGWLAAQAALDLAIIVTTAGVTDKGALSITLDIDADHSTETVRENAVAALFDQKTGLLSARNIRIGAPIFRSAISARLHEVTGVTSVRSILLGGLAMPHAIDPTQGNWFDFAATATVK